MQPQALRLRRRHDEPDRGGGGGRARAPGDHADLVDRVERHGELCGEMAMEAAVGRAGRAGGEVAVGRRGAFRT